MIDARLAAHRTHTRENCFAGCRAHLRSGEGLQLQELREESQVVPQNSVGGAEHEALALIQEVSQEIASQAIGRQAEAPLNFHQVAMFYCLAPDVSSSTRSKYFNVSFNAY